MGNNRPDGLHPRAFTQEPHLLPRPERVRVPRRALVDPLRGFMPPATFKSVAAQRQLAGSATLAFAMSQEVATLLWTTAVGFLGLVMGQILARRVSEAAAQKEFERQRILARDTLEGQRLLALDGLAGQRILAQDADLREYRRQQIELFHRRANGRMKLYDELILATRLGPNGDRAVNRAVGKLLEEGAFSDLSWHGVLEGEILEAAASFLVTDQQCDVIVRPYIDLQGGNHKPIPIEERIRISGLLMDAVSKVNQATVSYIHFVPPPGLPASSATVARPADQ